MFKLNEAIEILERTPTVLEQLLIGLSDSWIQKNEGKDTWSPLDIIGHLIQGDQIVWIKKTKLILEEYQNPFAPFDGNTQLENYRIKSISQLLLEFKNLRYKNLDILKKLKLEEDALNKKGAHPNFGEITLKQFLSTWVVHDLGHIRQIVRVMAKRYSNEVGPWHKYLRVLNE